MGRSCLIVIEAEHAPRLLPTIRELRPDLEWHERGEWTSASTATDLFDFCDMPFEAYRDQSDADDEIAVVGGIAAEMRDPHVILVGYLVIETMAPLLRALAARLLFILDNNYSAIMTGGAAAAELAADPRWLLGGD